MKLVRRSLLVAALAATGGLGCWLVLVEDAPRIARLEPSAPAAVPRASSSGSLAIAADERTATARRAPPSAPPAMPAPSRTSSTSEAAAPLAVDAPAAARRDAASASATPERLRELEVAAETAVAEGRGDDALSLLRQLAALGPEGWPAASKLLVRLSRSIDDDNWLGLNVNDFYMTARDGSFPDLYLQALGDSNADPALRRLAIRQLPCSGRADVSERLLARLGLEQDSEMAQRIAGAMVDRPDRRNVPALVAALAQQRDKDARGAIIEALGAIPGDEARAALATIAGNDGDPKVREAADALARGRTVAAPGYLVTHVAPGSQAEQVGIKPGDVVTAYNGAALVSSDALDKARASVGPQDRVALTVLRDGRLLSLTITGPRMGVNGRFVRPPGDPTS